MAERAVEAGWPPRLHRLHDDGPAGAGRHPAFDFVLAKVAPRCTVRSAESILRVGAGGRGLGIRGRGVGGWWQGGPCAAVSLAAVYLDPAARLLLRSVPSPTGATGGGDGGGGGGGGGEAVELVVGQSTRVLEGHSQVAVELRQPGAGPAIGVWRFRFNCSAGEFHRAIQLLSGEGRAAAGW
jgi:hypothetical protein